MAKKLTATQNTCARARSRTFGNFDGAPQSLPDPQSLYELIALAIFDESALIQADWASAEFAVPARRIP
jgi:hypothetical protein